MFRFCTALVITLFAVNAMAETYYDILKSEYEASRDAIDFTDFDKAGHPDAKSCLEIHPDRPNEELLVQVNRFTKYKEGQGPYLPGKTITKILYRRWSTNPFSNHEFEGTESSDRSREVKSELKRNEKTVWTLRVRKSDDTLVFQRDEVSGEERTRFYGYCYHKGAPEKERP